MGCCPLAEKEELLNLITTDLPDFLSSFSQNWTLCDHPNTQNLELCKPPSLSGLTNPLNFFEPSKGQ